MDLCSYRPWHIILCLSVHFDVKNNSTTSYFVIAKCSVRVVAGKGGVTVYEWDLLRLRKFMWERQNQQVSNALQACMSVTTFDKSCERVPIRW
mmetsp:Transcript_5264/g.15312  ORF Transcript_5264/g.15312 Transcript_5264/m.15312 type:complete len:93 (-) Transcript_5264:514-792(-)